MVEHVNIADPQIHEPKGVAAASIGQVYVANGAGSGAWSDLIASVSPTNEVIVNSLSDLPTPSGGIIALADNTRYVFGTSLTFTDRIVCGAGTALQGLSSFITTLTYTGTGIFITTGGALTIKDLSFNCATGDFFAQLSGHNFNFTNIQVVACNNLGTITDSLGFQIMDALFSNVAVNGFTLSGNNAFAIFQTNIATINGGAFLDLGSSTINAFSVTDSSVNLGVGTNFISGLPASGNVAAGSLATLLNNRITGSGTALSGVTEDDAQWQFSLNNVISDTRPDGLAYLSSPQTVTISAASTPVIIGGTWTEETSSQMTITAGGRITYDGVKPAKLPIDISLTLNPVSGSNKDLVGYVAINGVVDLNSAQTVRVNSGTPMTVSLHWQHTFQPNDYVEVFVANTTDTVNIEVVNAILRVN